MSTEKVFGKKGKVKFNQKALLEKIFMIEVFIKTCLEQNPDKKENIQYIIDRFHMNGILHMDDAAKIIKKWVKKGLFEYENDDLYTGRLTFKGKLLGREYLDSFSKEK